MFLTDRGEVTGLLGDETRRRVRFQPLENYAQFVRGSLCSDIPNSENPVQRDPLYSFVHVISGKPLRVPLWWA